MWDTQNRRVHSTGQPRNLFELGVLLARLRGDEGLRAAASRLGLSRTTLSRWENTGRVPLSRAPLLDQAYGCGGELEAVIVRLRHGDWDPYGAAEAKRHHAHRWPHAYEGQVWAWVRPQREQAGARHSINLRWGPWRQHVNRTLGAGGIAFLTGKAPDDVAVTFELTVDPPCYALFGTADCEASVSEDIRDDWTR